MELVHYYDVARAEVRLRDASNLPFICWPNGVPCFAANAYMVMLCKRNLSRNNNGGTLRQFAKDISHIIRYCFDKRIDFIQINGDRFTAFISELRNEKDPLNPMARKRDSNTLIAIGRKCIDFLDFIGKLNGDETFAINTVKAQQKKYLIRTNNSKTSKIEKLGWYHESFDTPGPRKNRSPISRKSIQELYDAIPILSSSKLDQQSKRFIDRRRTIMLRLLEMTGARIEEVAKIQVKDIEEALQQNEPLLRLITLKKRRSEHRFVPVLHQDMAALKAYVRVNRLMVIKRTIGASQDHGNLFISEVNGKPLTSRYMSNEIGLLRRTAGITGQACAHMFRNRFITKLFVRLINQYDFDNKDSFRKALLDANTLKQQVQQYTGHGSVDSLNTYIDLAFDEVANLVAVVSTVQLQEAFDSFDSNVDILQMDLKTGLPIQIYLEKYNELLNLRTTDVARINQLRNQNNPE